MARGTAEECDETEQATKNDSPPVVKFAASETVTYRVQVLDKLQDGVPVELFLNVRPRGAIEEGGSLGAESISSVHLQRHRWVQRQRGRTFVHTSYRQKRTM